MRVRLERVSKSFGSTPVLREVTLDIQDHELFFLLGPSGCGKTTLLRLIAGFYEPDQGSIYFGNQCVNDVPPHQRNTGMVFQNYALWPHMTVAENVAYGLDVRRLARAVIEQRVNAALAMVQMTEYARRSPNQLSGGQQQRVALARALVIQPDVLLLDEPLSNLDTKLRLEMRAEIRRIHAQTRITTIYVTHDQKESLSLADRLAILRQGIIEQVADPQSIYRQPANRFIAEFIGAVNWLTGRIKSVQANTLLIETDEGEFQALNTGRFSSGQTVWLGFRPEAVEMNSSAANRLETRVIQANYLGEIEEYDLVLPSGRSIKALELNPAGIQKPGTRLFVHINPSHLMVFSNEPT
jgi:iron(III) transport system ATP-binding protein